MRRQAAASMAILVLAGYLGTDTDTTVTEWLSPQSVVLPARRTAYRLARKNVVQALRAAKGRRAALRELQARLAALRKAG